MTVVSCKLPALWRIAIRSRFPGVFAIRGPRCHESRVAHGTPRMRWSTMSMLHRSLAQQGDSRLCSSLAIEETSEARKTIPFLLADIGEGIAEVELLQWYVSPGDHVSQFDRVCEVQSDKATVEITSRFDGYVESLDGNVGDMIKVGSSLMHIGVVDNGGQGSVSTKVRATDETDEPPSTAPTLHNVDDEEDKLHIPSLASSYELAGDIQVNRMKDKVFATPAVRKLGMDHNLDLSHIVGTGPKGRVLKADVLNLVLEKEERPAFSSTASPPTDDQSISPLLEEDRTVDVRGYNRMMIKSMTASLQVPHMHYGDEINMDEMIKCRKALKSQAEAHGTKLSFMPFAIKAVSLALNEYPILNASLNADEGKVTYHANHNIGVAMDTPRGLAVPVVKGCQNLSVLEIAVELNRLIQLGMESGLAENDISGATFSISNMGAIGGTYMSPIVVPPQVAIGAMGRIQRLPRFVEDRAEEVNVMQISWGGDHRVIDGATMARFSNRWKAYMEHPLTMVLSMK